MKKPNLSFKALMMLTALLAVIFVSCDESIDTTPVQEKISVQNGMLVFSSREEYSNTFDKLLKLDHEQIVKWENSIGFANSMRKYYESLEEEEENYDNEAFQEDELEEFTIPLELQALINKEGLVRVGEVYYLYLKAYEFKIPSDKLNYVEALKEDNDLNVEGVTKRLLKPEKVEVIDITNSLISPEGEEIDVNGRTASSTCSRYPYTCSLYNCKFSDLTPGTRTMPKLRTDRSYTFKYKPYPCIDCNLSFYLEFFPLNTDALLPYYYTQMRGRKRGKRRWRDDKMWASKLSLNVSFCESLCGNYKTSVSFDTENGDADRYRNGVGIIFVPGVDNYMNGTIDYEYADDGYPRVCGRLILK